MKTFLIQGVPPSIAQDGWWLSDPTPAKTPSWSKASAGCMFRLGLLVILIVLGDVLVWQVVPAVSLAVFGAALVVLALCATERRFEPKQLALIGGLTLLVLLPLVELVQPISVIIAIVGLSGVLAIVAGLRPSEVSLGALRLWPLGIERGARDAVASVSTRAEEPSGDRIKRFVMAWLMPLVLGAIFVLLLAEANPILQDWAEQATQVQLPNPARVAFWLCLLPFGWTVLSLRRLEHRLRYVSADRPTQFGPKRQGLFNAASVTRALMLFNVMFAVQTALDIAFLCGGVGLPEGVSYASYAQRGAYPLLVTALLAGAFALLTRRWTMADKTLRILLILWVAQNVALVISSLVRLDLYVDVYGLTRLRMAAGIWMALVAAGLGLIIAQVWRNQTNGWLMARGAALGFATLYLCSLVSFDATIARHNLPMDHKRYPHYLCQLGDAAKPIIEAHSPTLCEYNDRNIAAPKDWREWGFRNARARLSLTEIRKEGAL